MIENKILDSFKNKKVLVTGGTGLIGREIVNILSNNKPVYDLNSKYYFGIGWEQK